jgi:hypothetical protein
VLLIALAGCSARPAASADAGALDFGGREAGIPSGGTTDAAASGAGGEPGDVSAAAGGAAGREAGHGGGGAPAGSSGTAGFGGANAGASGTTAGGTPSARTPVPVYPQPGQTTGPGKLPPEVANVTYRDTLVYDNVQIVRDLGFSGVVNGQIIWTFGDTLLLTSGGGSAFSASDSAALGDMSNPTHVHDKNLNASGGPQQWIPLTADEEANGGLGRYAEGGTNVVEYAPNKGLVWFLKNDRKGGSDSIVGAGVATVTADANGPKATRVADTMWNALEPFWGDIGVTYNPVDQHVYAFGHGPASANLGAHVYLAKAPAAQATDVSAYRYWDQSQKTWGTQRFADGTLGTIKLTSDQAIFPNRTLGQSNAFWSNYYNTWMFVYGADVGYTDVMVMTAAQLEGPWTKGFTIASTCPKTCSGIRYAIAPHPEFDPTGKTLLVTWTDSNVDYVVQIEWK